MKKLLTFLLAALMIVPGLCACGKQETATVRLSEVTHSVFYAPQYVAMSQGFFADEGLDVELTNGGGADKVMTAVVSGSAAAAAGEQHRQQQGGKAEKCQQFFHDRTPQ